jgi:hypothetical protein
MLSAAEPDEERRLFIQGGTPAFVSLRRGGLFAVGYFFRFDGALN